jgi:hypothetical protein
VEGHTLMSFLTSLAASSRSGRPRDSMSVDHAELDERGGGGAVG